MRAVSDEEVIAAHHGTKLSIDVVGYLGNTSNMYQFVDIFSISEITLFRDVIQVTNEHLISSISLSRSSSISSTTAFHSLPNTFTTMFE